MKLKSCHQCRLGDHLFHSNSRGRKSQEIILIGGSRPYLWIGERGFCLATTAFLTPKTLRSLRDALTQACRRKSRKYTRTRTVHPYVSI